MLIQISVLFIDRESTGNGSRSATQRLSIRERHARRAFQVSAALFACWLKACRTCRFAAIKGFTLTVSPRYRMSNFCSGDCKRAVAGASGRHLIHCSSDHKGVARSAAPAFMNEAA
ncbi:hypothetical protein ABWH74_000513 [Burkholderia vietnamiensis]|jgi:hypothetical protein|uniref:FLZ-type domain-containing protein n=1 Tax=Burkholderia vietnamiensis TaxID=60552 RepID=A0AAW7SZU7_BURVI|nr:MULTISPECIES: hypothetical protein [Burkholderia]MBR8009421.1 hypothetical protein [Burkholderia vietnamiensis]MBR8085452.1 hypothetical protein [Burkholderia vietnamiensis]MBR8190451.1 hypothetical protein [Burkholderia vietnamiensis]MCA8269127.1 hypothetical protein [Burkholderia vietnamiensis]MCA8450324.1 hypothetical protein [Burkholderia vietnamiensis]